MWKLYRINSFEKEIFPWDRTKKTYQTRMHSSRMRTGRALTVSRGGGLHPEEIFWGEKKLKKKEKKKFGGTSPENFRHPPKNFRHPQKFQTPPFPSKILDTPLGPGQVPPPPPRVDRHTPVNLLPWPNFVAGGKNKNINWFLVLNEMSYLMRGC